MKFEDMLLGPHIVSFHPGTQKRGTIYIQYGSRFYRPHAEPDKWWVAEREQAQPFETDETARAEARKHNIKLIN